MTHFHLEIKEQNVNGRKRAQKVLLYNIMRDLK